MLAVTGSNTTLGRRNDMSVEYLSLALAVAPVSAGWPSVPCPKSLIEGVSPLGPIAWEEDEEDKDDDDLFDDDDDLDLGDDEDDFFDDDEEGADGDDDEEPLADEE